MIEFRRIEADQRNSLIRVLDMTAGAIRLARRFVECARVVTRASGDSALNFRMAFETLEPPSAGTEVVAGSAARDLVQILMRMR